MDSEVEVERTDDDNSAHSVTPVEVVGFVFRATRRHTLLGSGVAVGVCLVGLAIAQIVPQKYDASSRVFVDETVTKTEALSSPDRALPNLDPISGAFELLMQKSSLISVIEETGLVANWDANRSTPLRLKDRLVSTLGGGEPTFREKCEVLAKLLTTRLFLMRDKNVVTIRVIWPNPDAAFAITKAVQKRMIDVVRTRQNAAFGQAITILSEEVRRAREAIEPALAEMIRVRAQAKGEAQPVEIAAIPSVSQPTVVSRATGNTGASSTSAASGTVVVSREKGQQLSEKLSELSNKIQTAEEPWRRRQLELGSRMVELSAVYGKEHPQIVQLQAQIDTAKVPPAELVELQKAKADLLREVQNATAENTTTESKTTGKGNRSAGGRIAVRTVGGTPTSRGRQSTAEDIADEDPVVLAAKAGLTRAIEEYEGLNSRLTSARLQATAADVSFNTRFVITAEPELPRKPMFPLRLILSIASLFLAILFGLIAGAIRDLISGKVYESWQVRPLGVKSLGELPLPKRIVR
jgi:uncharacterized protein involved in exopolysaccharide biosynthesis